MYRSYRLELLSRPIERATNFYLADRGGDRKFLSISTGYAGQYIPNLKKNTEIFVFYCR